MDQGEGASYLVSSIGEHHLGPSVWDKLCVGKMRAVRVVVYRGQVDVARSNEYNDGVVEGVRRADEFLRGQLFEVGQSAAA